MHLPLATRSIIKSPEEKFWLDLRVWRSDLKMVIESTDMDEISEGENVEQEERTT